MATQASNIENGAVELERLDRVVGAARMELTAREMQALELYVSLLIEEMIERGNELGHTMPIETLRYYFGDEMHALIHSPMSNRFFAQILLRTEIDDYLFLVLFKQGAQEARHPVRAESSPRLVEPPPRSRLSPQPSVRGDCDESHGPRARVAGSIYFLR